MNVKKMKELRDRVNDIQGPIELGDEYTKIRYDLWDEMAVLEWGGKEITLTDDDLKALRNVLNRWFP